MRKKENEVREESEAKKEATNEEIEATTSNSEAKAED